MFVQTIFAIRPLEAVLIAAQGGARDDEVVALDHALGIEFQFVIDRLVDAVHFCQAGVPLPVDHEAEDVSVGRLGEDSQDDPLSRQFRRKLVAQAAAQLLRAPDAFADEQSVAALIERDDAVREPAGRRRRARLGAFQNVPADERAGLSLVAVEDVRRFGRDQLFDFLATENDRAARVRDVAEFVRINGDRVGVMNGLEAFEDLFRRPRAGDLADRAGGLNRVSLLVEEEGPDVTAPRRVAVVIKRQPTSSHLGLKLDQAMNLINGSLFSRAQDRDQGDDRYALVRASQEYFSQSAYVRAEVAVHRDHFDLLLAQAEGFDDLLHRIVRRRGNQGQGSRNRSGVQVGEEALNPLSRNAVGRQLLIDLPVDLGLPQVGSAPGVGGVQARAQ